MSVKAIRASASMSRVGSRGQLARAGWHILTPEQLAANRPPPSYLEAEGLRLVEELASLWSKVYSHTIRSAGYNDGGFHYECIFSRPLEELPVPRIVVYTRFALVSPTMPHGRPGSPSGLSLLFSFEEGDLRHSWQLGRGPTGRLQIASGQQCGSLRNGYFEAYLDRFVTEKEKARSFGISLVTSFEETRLTKPVPPSESGILGGAMNLGAEKTETEASIGTDVGVDADVATVADDAESQDPEMAQALRDAIREAGLACEKVPVPTSLLQLLTNVFDAADEEKTGELPHHEVARLLGATLSGLGLRPWDIQLLMVSTEENDRGFIECKPFIDHATDTIKELRRRRLSYVAKGLPKCEVSPDSIKFVFGPELGETADQLFNLFTARSQDDPGSAKYEPIDTSNQVVPSTNKRKTLGRMASMQIPTPKSTSILKKQLTEGMLSDDATEMQLAGIFRKACWECLQQLSTRISPQEACRIMQMLPEDEDGFVRVESLLESLEALRSGALHNALVESDRHTLWQHLVNCFRQAGLSESGQLKIWQLMTAFLRADQICISRLQIHVLLCLALSSMDSEGTVDVRSYVATCMGVIPHMLDAAILQATADHLQLEAAEMQRMKENAEIAALGASKVGTLGQDEKEKTLEVEVDQETVEKTLIQALGDARGPATVQPNHLFAVLHSGDANVSACQLTPFELCGLVGEMMLDKNGEVEYVPHIKRTVGLIFELRRHDLLKAYLSTAEDNFAKMQIVIPKVDDLEASCPLVPVRVLPPEPAPAEAPVIGRRASRRVTNMDERVMTKLASSGRQSGADEGKMMFRVVEDDGIRMKSLEKRMGEVHLVNGRGFERRKAFILAQRAAASAALGGL